MVLLRIPSSPLYLFPSPDTSNFFSPSLVDHSSNGFTNGTIAIGRFGSMRSSRRRGCFCSPVKAVDKEPTQFEVDRDRVLEALEELDQQLQALSQKQTATATPKKKASVPSSTSYSDPVSAASASDVGRQPELGFLFQAFDDELGLPPTVPTSSEEGDLAKEEPEIPSGKGFRQIWGFEDLGAGDPPPLPFLPGRQSSPLSVPPLPVPPTGQLAPPPSPPLTPPAPPKTPSPPPPPAPPPPPQKGPAAPPPLPQAKRGPVAPPPPPPPKPPSGPPP